jgi:MarR family transcriptional repressor of emrRAB
MDGRTLNLLTALVVALGDVLDDATRDVTHHPPTVASALVTLHAEPGARVDELSRVLGITASGTVRLVDRLVAEGLVERRPGRSGRMVALHPTSRGAAVAEAIVTNRRQALQRALEALSPTQRDQLAGLVEPLLVGLTSDRYTADRICRLCDHHACPQDRCPVERSVP